MAQVAIKRQGWAEVTRQGGGQGPAEDILQLFKVAEADRDGVYEVANPVHNPNRYFDALKALGAIVKTRKTDKTATVNGKEYPLFTVQFMVPAGDLKPHRKPSQVR